MRVRLQALGHYEPSLSLVKISANGERGETRHVSAVLTDDRGLMPWHARAMLTIGLLLRRFADWLERN